MTESMRSMAQWQTFADGVLVLKDLRDIQAFNFRAEVPMTVIWANDEVRLRVAQLVYDEVLDILKVSGLYRYDQLSVLGGEEQILVRYDDDRYGFEVSLQGESVTIARRGSGFERFHRWYVEVAPHFGGLVEKICSAIEASISAASGLERRMSVHDASYSFRFILFDVHDETNGSVLSNSEVLQGLIPQSPGATGGLAETRQETESIARLDVTFHKFQEREGRPWIEIYRVEGPSNREWSSVWVTFTIAGRSFEKPSEPSRMDFDATSFIADYVTPLVSFLRDRGLQGFLTDLLAGRRFSTTASVLP
jgi:hypothetical protein